MITFCDKNNLNLADYYEDNLEELVAALEGQCNKDFVLHPEHYRNASTTPSKC